jgi:hypothetical protein
MRLIIACIVGVGAAPPRVAMEVFYEARCPDSRQLFLDGLTALSAAPPALRDAVDLRLVPFGKARVNLTAAGHALTGAAAAASSDPDYPAGVSRLNTTLAALDQLAAARQPPAFACQHGALECAKNRLHSCALARAPSPMAGLALVRCLFADAGWRAGAAWPAAGACKALPGMRACAAAGAPEGDRLQLAAARTTHTAVHGAAMRVIPTVLIGGKELPCAHGQCDVVGALCRHFAGAQQQGVCEAAMPASDGPAAGGGSGGAAAGLRHVVRMRLSLLGAHECNATEPLGRAAARGNAAHASQMCAGQRRTFAGVFAAALRRSLPAAARAPTAAGVRVTGAQRAYWLHTTPPTKSSDPNKPLSVDVAVVLAGGASATGQAVVAALNSSAFVPRLVAAAAPLRIRAVVVLEQPFVTVAVVGAATPATPVGGGTQKAFGDARKQAAMAKAVAAIAGASGLVLSGLVALFAWRRKDVAASSVKLAADVEVEETAAMLRDSTLSGGDQAQ